MPRKESDAIEEKKDLDEEDSSIAKSIPITETSPKETARSKFRNQLEFEGGSDESVSDDPSSKDHPKEEEKPICQESVRNISKNSQSLQTLTTLHRPLPRKILPQKHKIPKHLLFRLSQLQIKILPHLKHLFHHPTPPAINH